jgi:hypothetical protein
MINNGHSLYAEEARTTEAANTAAENARHARERMERARETHEAKEAMRSLFAFTEERFTEPVVNKLDEMVTYAQESVMGLDWREGTGTTETTENLEEQVDDNSFDVTVEDPDPPRDSDKLEFDDDFLEQYRTRGGRPYTWNENEGVVWK